MSQNITHRLPLSVVATQLSSSLGHPVAENDIVSISYDALAVPQPTVRVTLRSVGTRFLKTTEFLVFTRSQVVTFYNNLSGQSIVASTISLIQFDSEDSSFIELIPPQI